MEFVSFGGYGMQSSPNGNKIGCSLDDEDIHVLKHMSWLGHGCYSACCQV